MDRSESTISSSDLSNGNPKSPSKSSRGKRNYSETGSRSDVNRKRVKMRDLDSVFRSEETQSRHSDFQLNKEATTLACVGKKGEGERSKITDTESTHSGMLQEVTTGQDSLSLLEAAACLSLAHVDHHSPNLKTDVRHSNNSGCDTTSALASNDNKSSAATKPEKDLDLNIKTSSSIGMNLNEDVSSRLNQELFCSYRSLGHVKSRVSSECGSSTGPLEENIPLRMWKEMKQNGFLSSNKHGGIPVHKQKIKSRMSKNDLIKKKMEIAKREQVNRFTKIAAPSGLLSGLNPGIINHVRNSKQVHSIIEALVRSEKHDDQNQKRQVAQLGGGSTESNIPDAGADEVGFYEDESCKALLGSRHITGPSPFSLNRVSIPSSTECKGGIGELHETERSIFYETSIASQYIFGCEDDTLMLKLSSATALTQENADCMSIEEFSPNQETVTSLSVKAATVASQWLELLHQDLRGRLAALQRSRKRVRAVILSEFPCLLSYDFTSNQKNDAASDTHMARWISLFAQMDKTLSEEEKHLESWLRQVKEMQLHCERGLQFVMIPRMDIAPLEKDIRSKKLEAIERECAVRAAAASIYSTCNLVTSAENVSCF
ncbi:hypothetical protein MRB53_000799 [Persea americana]|uniref:Uncharacterized protein n=1 Tax=Persea americana TaxID=3435 RepID=A0ACC2MQ23_PERAE|nr:hypothetical protein MRB53_000799 [Persea americana]